MANNWEEKDYDFVSTCWNDVRDCLLCEYYFGHKVDSISTLNRVMEITVASTASGSVLSGWALWSSVFGNYIWGTLGGVAAVVSIIKPVVRLDLTISNYSKLLVEYRNLVRSFEGLIKAIQQSETIDTDIRERYKKLDDRMLNAEALWPPKLNKRLVDKYHQQVNTEMPKDSLWAPKIPGKHPNVPAPVPKP